METLRYHSLEELRTLSLRELQALWELVPTDRQRAYKAAYEREVRTAGAVGTDQLERKVAAEMLRRYGETALVPIGSRWARTPGRVQDTAKRNAILDAPEDDAKPSSGKPSLKVVLAIGLALLLFAGMMLPRLNGGRSTAMIDGTPTAALTPTPAISLTPTPLALGSQDDVIHDGDGGRQVAYPVSLQVILPDGSAPRVWVVQRRRVQASEWRYDENPDTASFVSGMSVRPVIGIPWSDETAAYFAAIGDGTSFQITMNTGALLTYRFEDKHEVRRSETGIFRQVSPGLALLLLGETDEEGFPTATRTLITACLSARSKNWDVLANSLASLPSRLSRTHLTSSQPLRRRRSRFRGWTCRSSASRHRPDKLRRVCACTTAEMRRSRSRLTICGWHSAT